MAHKLNKSVIVQLAQQNVGRGAELDVICDHKLNLILDQLFENFTWEERLNTNTNISFASGSKTWTPPSDYGKAKILKYVDTDSNPDQPPNLAIELITYADYQLIQVPDVTGPPKVAAITRTIGIDGEFTSAGYIYPKPDKTYTGTLVYYYQPEFDEGSGEDIHFGDPKTILDLLTNDLKGMGYGSMHGTPYDPFLLEKIIGRARRNKAADLGINPQRARLDRRVFGKRANWNSRSWLERNR